MATDLRVTLPNRPGTVGKALDAIAGQGVEVSGIGTDIRPGDRWGFLHVLVEDAEGARRGLEGAGIEISTEHDVDVVTLEEGAGSMAAVVKSYAGRNIEVLYMATHSKLVVGTEDMQRARYGVRTRDAGH